MTSLKKHISIFLYTIVCAIFIECVDITIPKDIDLDEAISDILLITDKENYNAIGFDTAKLQAFGLKNGEVVSDITSDCKFYLRLNYDYDIGGNLYSTTRAGKSSLYAVYQNKKSAIKTVNFNNYSNQNLQNNKKILLEQFVGGDKAFALSYAYGNQAKELNDKVILVRYFYQAIDPNFTQEAFDIYTRIQQPYAFNKIYNGILNRQEPWDLSYNTLIDQILEPLIFRDLKMVSSLDGNLLNINIEIFLGFNLEHDIELEAYLTKDIGVIQQKNLLTDNTVLNKYGDAEFINVNPYLIYIKHFQAKIGENQYSEIATIPSSSLNHSIVQKQSFSLAAEENWVQNESSLYIVFLIKNKATGEIMLAETSKFGETLKYLK